MDGIVRPPFVVRSSRLPGDQKGIGCRARRGGARIAAPEALGLSPKQGRQLAATIAGSAIASLDASSGHDLQGQGHLVEPGDRRGLDGPAGLRSVDHLVEAHAAPTYSYHWHHPAEGLPELV